MTGRRPSSSCRAGRAVVLVLLVAIGLAGCGPDEAPEAYSEATRVAMVGGCAEKDADPDLVEVCACAYDRMEEDLGFEAFADLETRLADGDGRLPASVAGMIRDCIREVSGTRG